mgnify:FL=1
MQPFKPENVLVCIRQDEKGEGKEAEGGGGGKEIKPSRIEALINSIRTKHVPRPFATLVAAAGYTNLRFVSPYHVGPPKPFGAPL